MGAAMYAAGEADAAAAGGTTGTGDSDDDVVDAEIVDDEPDATDEGESK
jgi:molecular chaperone DnaK